MCLAAGVDNHPQDTVVFAAAAVFISGVAVTGVAVVVAIGATSHLEGGVIQVFPRGIRGGRDGVMSLMCFTVAEGHRTRSGGHPSILINSRLSDEILKSRPRENKPSAPLSPVLLKHQQTRSIR